MSLPRHSPAPGSRTALVGLLSRERALLARVAAGDRAARHELRATSLLRAVHAESLAATLGLPAEPSLRSLAGAVEEPWRSIYRDYRTAMRAATHSADGDLPPSVRDFLS